MAEGPSQTIYLVSDGTCRTCEQLVKAVLVQFEHDGVQLVRKPNVRRAGTVAKVVQEASDRHAIVFYTLVTEEVRQAIQAAARQHMVPLVDLLGPALVGLYDLFHATPRAKPGILYKSNKDHYDRIDAVEYTLHHDDGRREHELEDADVVLVGVSRASKSTTCFYLAYSGIRAANVPLFADREPSEHLRRLDPRRVIGLTTNPHRLRSVREARMRDWGGGIGNDYTEKIQIARELRAANAQMAEHGWSCIDASYKAIEEIAREVRQLLAEAGIDLARRETGGRTKNSS